MKLNIVIDCLDEKNSTMKYYKLKLYLRNLRKIFEECIVSQIRFIEKKMNKNILEILKKVQVLCLYSLSNPCHVFISSSSALSDKYLFV